MNSIFPLCGARQPFEEKPVLQRQNFEGWFR